MILQSTKQAQEKENQEAWINVHGETRDIHPIVHVRCMNGSGLDVATRRRTAPKIMSSADLCWNFDETLELPLQKGGGRSNFTLEFKVSTGDEWMEPIATLKMSCARPVNAAASKNKQNDVGEVLMWNRKRALRRRFSKTKADAPDAPPAVFYAGELIVSVEYIKGASATSFGTTSSTGGLSKTEIVPSSKVTELTEERDRFVVTIKKITALGDDGTGSKSSAHVWGATLALLLYFTIGVIVYVYGENFTFVDSLWFCVATITTVGYGDVKPKTDAGKLFTAFYALVGYVLVGVAVGMITAYVVDQQRLKRKIMIQKAQALALGAKDQHAAAAVQKENVLVGNDDDDLDLGIIVNKNEEDAAMKSEMNEAAMEIAAEKRRRKEACVASVVDWVKTFLPVVLVVALGVVVMMAVEGLSAVDVSFFFAFFVLSTTTKIFSILTFFSTFFLIFYFRFFLFISLCHSLHAELLLGTCYWDNGWLR